MTDPPHRRSLAVGLSAMALAVAIGTAVTVLTLVGRDSAGNRAGAPPAATLSTSAASAPPSPSASAFAALPTTTPPSPRPTATTKPAPSSAPPTARITFADALAQMRAAVQDGASAREIRDDVATDLLNLVQNLSNANSRDVTAQIAQLRTKVQQRLAEGSVSPARATILQARLTDIEGAAGT